MNYNNVKKQMGITLIELMIAMVLGLFIMGGVSELFINSKQVYRVQENQSRLQENARFAMNFITNDIRMAGFFGCLGKNYETSNIENALRDQTNIAWTLEPIEGYDNVDSEFSIFTSVVPGTDVIVFRGLQNEMVPLVEPYSNSAQMFVDPTFNDDCSSGAQKNVCHEGEILMVTDCTQGTIFQVTQTTATGGADSVINIVHSGNATFTPGNASPVTFVKEYGTGAHIARFNSYAYFIRLNPAGQSSLYRASVSLINNEDNSFFAEELVEGVENMQLLYGEDTDGDNTANYYLSAGAVDMDKVVSVRVDLLVSSLDDNITTEKFSYYFPPYVENKTLAIDYKIRRSYSSTIAIRNRLP